MRPLLLLMDRVGLTESPFDKARRRARALREMRKKKRFEQMLRDELATMTCLRQAAREDALTPKRRWAFVAK